MVVKLKIIEGIEERRLICFGNWKWIGSGSGSIYPREDKWKTAWLRISASDRTSIFIDLRECNAIIPSCRHMPLRKLVDRYVSIGSCKLQNLLCWQRKCLGILKLYITWRFGFQICPLVGSMLLLSSQAFVLLPASTAWLQRLPWNFTYT